MVKLVGGTKLQKELSAIGQMARSAGKLKAGFFENATYPDGTLVAMVAAVQNYGSTKMGIPARPFFSNMVRKNQGDWPAVIAQAMKANKYDARKALNFLGQEIEGQIKQSIQDTNSPKLKPATVKAKGFDKPLIDSARMYQSATFEVS